jgi:hypothetical protein
MRNCNHGVKNGFVFAKIKFFFKKKFNFKQSNMHLLFVLHAFPIIFLKKKPIDSNFETFKTFRLSKIKISFNVAS